MKRLLFALLLLAAFPAFAQETPIYCITATQTNCQQSSKVGTGYQGDPAYTAYGKLNAWGLQLGLFSNQTANEVLATPSGSTGIPSLRALVGADIPPINLAGGNENGGVTGTLPIANGGTGITTLTANYCLAANSTATAFVFVACGSGGGGMVYPGAGIPNSSGTGWNSSYSTTGSGNVVLSTSPTLTTPALGTPSAIVLTNATGTATGLTAGLAQNLTGSPAITVSSCSGCGSGSGTVNNAAQYATPYYTNSGSTNVLGGLASPTSGPGYFSYRYDPSSSSAVAPTADQVGASVRAISGSTSTDTAGYGDVLGIVLHVSSATSAVTETLPTPTTLNNANFAYNYCNRSTYTDTITPTTWTISLNAGSAGSSISVSSGVCVTVTVDPYSSNEWNAFAYGASSSGSGTTIPTQYESNPLWGALTWSSSSGSINRVGTLNTADTQVCTTNSTIGVALGTLAHETCASGTTANTTQSIVFSDFHSDVITGTSSISSNVRAFAVAAESATSSVRFWPVFLTDQTVATMGTSDTVSGNLVGIRFSTAVPDTDYTLVLCKAGTCATTDIGIAGDTSIHDFEIKMNDATQTATGCVDSTCVTQTTDYPGSFSPSTSGLGIALDNTTTTSVSLSWSQVWAAGLY